MCYSLEQSKIAFTVNIFTCYILYIYKNSPTYKILALFFLFVGLIQFFDIIFWENQNIKDEKQEKINYITTKIAMIANHLQPIVLAILIYLFTGKLGKSSQIIILIYTIFVVFFSILAYKKINYTLVDEISVRHTNEIKPSLNWTWRSKILNWPWRSKINTNLFYVFFLISYIVLFYENFKYPLNIFSIFIGGLSFILSAYYYKRTLMGRFWCKVVAFMPIFFILFDKIIHFINLKK